MPVVVLVPEHTKDGTIYHAANEKAEAIKYLVGAIIQDHHLPKIEALGFSISFPNGQPIKFPKHAYKRYIMERPRHLDDRM